MSHTIKEKTKLLARTSSRPGYGYRTMTMPTRTMSRSLNMIMGTITTAMIMSIMMRMPTRESMPSRSPASWLPTAAKSRRGRSRCLASRVG